MKYVLGFFFCLVLASCSPTPQAGESYKHNATGEEVKVTMVGKPADIQKYIEEEKSRVSEPGHTPNFEIQSPAGETPAEDNCVLYTIITPSSDPRAPNYGYFIYPEGAFTKAFGKTN